MRASGVSEAMDAGDGVEMETEQGGDMGTAAQGHKKQTTKRGKRGARKVDTNNERGEEWYARVGRRKRDAQEEAPGGGRGAVRAGETQPPMLRRRASEAQEDGEP